MAEQDAGPFALQGRLPQDRPEALQIRRVAVVHADNLQAIEGDLFVVQGADAGALHRGKIFSAVRKFLVISCDEIYSQRSRKPMWKVRKSF